MGNTERHILVFGSSNAGKTSMINEMCGTNYPVSSAAIGTTLETKKCSIVRHKNHSYQFYDTAGLNETNKGAIKPGEAIRKIMDLIIASKDGFNLLIMVMRSGTILAHEPDNYNMFFRGLANEKIPIICVITGCETGSSPASYAKENRAHYDQNNMEFQDIVSTTFAKSVKKELEVVYKDLRKESADNVWSVIEKYANEDPNVIVKSTPIQLSIFKKMCNIFWNFFHAKHRKYPTMDFDDADLNTLLIRLGVENPEERNTLINDIQKMNGKQIENKTDENKADENKADENKNGGSKTSQNKTDDNQSVGSYNVKTK